MEEEMSYEVLHCTAGGSFEASCTVAANGKKSCFCLDANNGKAAHSTPYEIAETDEKPNCGKFYLSLSMINGAKS